MERGQFKEILSSYSVTTTTPFTTDLSKIDTDAIFSNVRFLVNHEVPLIIPNGNTGEFYSLSRDEWEVVLRTTVDAVGTDSVVMTGVGHSLSTVMDQIEVARDLGVEAVMVHYPQHVFISEEGLYDYYKHILEGSSDLNVVLYKKGPLLSDDVLEKLISFKNLVGVKYAFGRIVDFSRTIHRLGQTIVWSCGTAERFAPFFFLAGASALTSGLCNFAPQVTKKMYDNLKDGNYRDAMKIQAMITPLEDLREGHGKANNVPVIKAAMDHVGLKGGLCRPPIHRLSDEERSLTTSIIEEWDL